MLINEYQPGQGIMPHEDGAAYHPMVATVSLGAPIVLDIYEKRNENEGQGEITSREPRYRILQEPRSLLITTEKMYTDYLHGIEERLKDENLRKESICNWDLLGDTSKFEGGEYERVTRTSLTYRDVLRVSKLGNSIKFLAK